MATQLSKNEISAILNVLCRPHLQLQYPCEEFNDLPRMEDIDWGKMGSTLDQIWDGVVKETQTDGFKHAFGNHLEKIDGRIKVVED